MMKIFLDVVRCLAWAFFFLYNFLNTFVTFGLVLRRTLDFTKKRMINSAGRFIVNGRGFFMDELVLV